MKLTVFGSTGGIGREVVKQALDAGYEVRAVTRCSSAINVSHESLEIIMGDVLDAQSVRRAVDGQAGVVFTVGVRDRAPTTVYSEGVANVIEAMQAAQAGRLICISASALDPGPLWQRLIAKPILWSLFREMYTDLARMEQAVQCSPLDWTILRPPRLTDGPLTRQYRVAINRHLPRILTISRADTGDFIIRHLSDPATHRAFVEIGY